MRPHDKDILVFLLLLLSIIGILYKAESCVKEKQTPEEIEAYKEAEERREKGCYSKYSGSSPRCWKKSDWEAYCKRVQCK